MSYKALYRTYRPKDFSTVVGQEHIVSTLQNIIASQKIGHAYLFSGPRGTGKTSVAHVFAREVNRNVSGELQFSEMDIIEIDAASNNGVAEVRSLIENSRYAPNDSKYKVYIIDEVHMLTKGAFNALLKTLEEPPAHVIFILATTEPHKLPVTILSRCQRFNFRRIEDALIENQLKRVLDKEQITFEDEAIKFIARLAQGGLRDALSIADQAAAFGSGNITFTTIAEVFGIISTDNQIKLINFAFESKTKELIALVNTLMENGADIERISISLLGILRDFIVFSKTREPQLLETVELPELGNLMISVDFAYRAIDVLMKMISTLKYSDVPRQTFELALLQLVRDIEEVDAVEEIEVHKTGETIVREAAKAVEENKGFTTPKSQEDVNALTSVRKLEEDIKNKEKEELFGDLFATREQNLKDKIEVTGEFKILETDEASELVTAERQIHLDSMQIEEDILSTGEFELGTSEVMYLPVVDTSPVETTKTEESVVSKTEDFKISEPSASKNIPTWKTAETKVVSYDSIDDILKEFASSETEAETVKANVAFTEEELLNLLVLANHDERASVKQKWNSISLYDSNEKFVVYASLIEQTKVIAAGDNFILVATDDKAIVDQINDLRDEENFKHFIAKVFEKPRHFYTISKEVFEQIKVSYSTAAAEKKLPKPKPLSPVVLSKETESEEEAYGRDLFGELFK